MAEAVAQDSAETVRHFRSPDLLSLAGSSSCKERGRNHMNEHIPRADSPSIRHPTAIGVIGWNYIARVVVVEIVVVETSHYAQNAFRRP